MLDNIAHEDVLFLDIETVPQYNTFDEVPENFKAHWEHKVQALSRNEEYNAAEAYDKAGIYAEFGKIICISVGYLRGQSLRIKSFANDNEFVLLNEFADLLNKSYSKVDSYLCAHNGKEFDYPFIARRLLINGIKIPAILDIASCKPWEVKHLDTMELWKFGDKKSYTSLSLLSELFGIKSPKDDIMGKDVSAVYWKEKNLNRIVTYCQKDVITLVQLFLKYKNEPLISDENIIIVMNS